MAMTQYNFIGMDWNTNLMERRGLLNKNRDNSTITQSNLIDAIAGEKPCIFLGKLHKGCNLFHVSGFVYPVFRCPTRESTDKINGISNYPTIATDGLCPSLTLDPSSPLEPNDESCDPLARRPVFQQCKNSFTGGKVKFAQ